MYRTLPDSPVFVKSRAGLLRLAGDLRIGAGIGRGLGVDFLLHDAESAVGQLRQQRDAGILAFDDTGQADDQEDQDQQGNDAFNDAENDGKTEPMRGIF